MRVLLLAALILTGVRCKQDEKEKREKKKDSVFVYSTVGGDALLPCISPLPPDCSSVTWTFYKGGQVRYSEEVSEGRVRGDSDKSSRMSVTPNCSISLRELIRDDAGSYVCLMHGNTITNVYLSLLTVTSASSITDLQPGGNVTLSCILFTYYDVGSCKSYSSTFVLSWAAEDGTMLPTDPRYEQIVHRLRTRCNITLVKTLRQEDHNRKWRCQVNTTENSRTAAYVDFTSSLLFQNPPPPPTQNPVPAATTDCPVQLPISRIVLCAALPVMVLIVGFFTWRGDRKRAKASAAGIGL